MEIVTMGAAPLPRIETLRRVFAQWRVLALCLAGYLLVWTAWSAPGPGGEDAPQPEQGIKAAFVYKFLGYVEWPAAILAQGTAPLVIGVLGADDLADELRTLVAGRSLGSRPIDVRRVHEADALTGVNVLFVGRDESSRLARLAPAARRRSVLVVSDFEGALDEGSVINLLVVDNRVRFEVSLDAADKSGLKLSSRMLAVALSVRPVR